MQGNQNSLNNCLYSTDALIEPSNFVLITNLRRPFTTSALNDMLSEHGKVEELWMSDNKTHCIVRLSEKESAAKIKEKIHRLVWPKGGGAELEVEFIDDETAKALKEKSRKSPVVFINNEKTTKIEVLNSNESSSARSQSRSYELGGNGLSSASMKGQVSKKLKISGIKNGRNERETMEVETVNANPVESILELDKLFKKTIAKPPIYYLPLTLQQVRRLTYHDCKSNTAIFRKVAEKKKSSKTGINP